MSYNRADYVKVKEEFTNKYMRARKLAESRRADIHAQIPEIFEIDRVLAGTGMEIMSIISSGGNTEKIEALEARNNALIAKRGRLLEENGYPADYTDAHYECDRCGDTGYVDAVMCECMKRALVRAGYESSGLGALIGKQTFDNFDSKYYSENDGSRKIVERYVQMLKSFAEDFVRETYRNFLMIGTTGLGKTHLSTAVAQTVIDKGFDVLYVSAVSMLGDFEAKRFGTSTSLSATNDTARYYDCDLLIIDDLGTELINKFTQSSLYEIINTRINVRKSTIINTNLTPSEINTLYSERISSRLLGEYQPLRFKGVDIRKQKSI